MADEGLDDFFAKKDKSKKKSKSKITPADLDPETAAKQAIKKIKKKKAKENQTDKDTGASGTSKPREEDAEWEDFQSEEKDYTGLRIQNLQISTKEEEDKKSENEAQSDDEDGEGSEKRDTSQGPWNQQGQTQPTKREEPPEPPKPKPKAEEPPAPSPAKSGKYVPPGMRRQMEMSASNAASGTTQSGPRRKKVAPNLMSVEDFPTLGGVPFDEDAADEMVYQRVRAGGKSEENPRGGAAKLELGNKYHALTNTDN